MSMLSSQIEELRRKADELRLIHIDDTSVGTLFAAIGAMREAADTIESMRDRLQAVGETSYDAGFDRLRAVGETSYDAGFDNGMRAVLQQLDWLIHEGASVDEIQGWIDRQWEARVRSGQPDPVARRTPEPVDEIEKYVPFGKRVN